MRYYFHIRDVRGVIHDEEGTELPSLEAARQEARASARDLAMEDLRRGGPICPSEIQIANADGIVLENVPVRAVVH